MKKLNSELYLSHLWELGQTDISQLTDYDMASMTSALIAEQPLSLLPPIEQKDRARQLLVLIGKWIDTEDEDLGRDILDLLRNLVIKSMEPTIEKVMMDYAKREKMAQEQAKEDRLYDNYIYIKNRI